MIPVQECIDRGTYIIKGRNIVVGVFLRERNAFIGIRRKWGNVFLDEEFHYDNGLPYGTVEPLKFVEACPVANVKRVQDMDKTDYQNLFDYLKPLAGARRDELDKERDEILRQWRERQAKKNQ